MEKKFPYELMQDQKELATFGLELNAIKDILQGVGMTWRADSTDYVLDKGRTPWEIFKENRKSYLKSGLLLEIIKIKNDYYRAYMDGNQKAWIEGNWPKEQVSPPIARLLIDLSQLVTELEEKTGIKL